MKELKVGDRIKVYTFNGIYKSKVDEIEGDFVTFTILGTKRYCAHRKQCRRLKKKEKEIPREWYLNVYPNRYAEIYNDKQTAHNNCHTDGETILVREVIERKK